MNTTEDTSTSEVSEEPNDELPSSQPNEESDDEFPELVHSRRTLRSLNREERMRVLFGLLFHRMQDHLQSSSETNDPQGDIQPPNRDLVVLQHDQALTQNVVCRFCLGQAGDEGDNNTTSIMNPFVSPCNCTGGSEWVHLKCFRRWQCQAASSSSTLAASKVCSVCRCAYLLPPLSMSDDSIQPGALLVYMEEDSRPSSFQKSLILILDHSVHGTTGLVVSHPLPLDDWEQPCIEEELSQSIVWKKGGPVCGGRLGITRYLIAHSFDHTLEAEYDDQPLISHSVTATGPENPEEEEEEETRLKLQFVYDPKDMTCPATFRGHELGHVLLALTKNRESQDNGAFYVFAGYCKWRGGQLASELQRGVWSVCNGVRPEEMLQDEESWSRLRDCGDRLLSYEDLIQEDEAVLGINH